MSSPQTENYEVKSRDARLSPPSLTFVLLIGIFYNSKRLKVHSLLGLTVKFLVLFGLTTTIQADQTDQCEGEPLLLSPLIRRGEVQLARQLSLVNDSLVYEGTSYSGYLTVNNDLGDHMFFWYFPSTYNPDVPLLLWLNGGPGVTSMQGLFLENGPLSLDDKVSLPLSHRNHNWVDKFHMLYIDNPVGVGYSFSESGPKLYTGENSTQQLYTEDLYRTLVQFYQIFPELRQSDLYIGGQSYAGKYVPALAYRVHMGNERGDAELPLKGIYIGGPYFSPEDAAYGFAEFKHSFGYTSISELDDSRKRIKEMFESFSKGEFNKENTYSSIKALQSSNNPDSLKAVFENMGIILTDVGLFYNVLLDGPRNTPGSRDNYVTGEEIARGELNAFLNNDRLKKAIHAGCREVKLANPFDLDLLSLKHTDLLVNTKAQMSVLLNKYKVLIYNGDYDLIVNSASVESQIYALAWDLADEYKKTSRQVWYGDKNEVKGYFTQTGQFCRVIVHGSGHQVPRDKPKVTLEMMTQFVNNGCIG